ncbi:MAG TPA: hypothetical protein VF646_13670 [Cytophagales bacterium]|jgi:hypothetical protein
MKALLTDTLTQLFPQAASPAESMEELYMMPFDPEQLILCFKGWEYYVPCDRYFDKSEDCNLVWFEEDWYFINGKAFRRPLIMADFLGDCRTMGIEVKWNKEMAYNVIKAIAVESESDSAAIAC